MSSTLRCSSKFVGDRHLYNRRVLGAIIQATVVVFLFIFQTETIVINYSFYK